MAYVSLYRKYRSQTFDDVVGQDHVVRTIRNAIKAGRIGQGYLFCGSRGTGKTTVARLIAKALNCAYGPTDEPCNICSACVDITNGAAVDVIEMDAASNRSVDDVDLLREGVKYPPMSLRYKVYIIDEAHQLSPQAKDAFLKTLEEPPPHAVFILATTESHKIPITIRSRCQQFDFRRGTNEEIISRLEYVVAGENVVADDDALEIIARSANGSYRDSLSLLEQVIAYTDGKITSADVYTVLGMVDEEVLMELSEVLASSDSAAAFRIADRLLREGRDVRELLKSAANHFRDLLALKVGADLRKRGNERWESVCHLYTEDRLIRIIEIFAAAEKDLKWNEQHRLGLEMALLKAMSAGYVSSPVESPAFNVQRQQMAAKKAAAYESPEPPKEVSSTVSGLESQFAKHIEEQLDAQDAGDDAASQHQEKQLTLGEIQRNWNKILMHIQKVLNNKSLAALVREGRPVNLRDNILTIAFAPKWSFHQQRVEKQVSVIEKGIWDIMGAKLKVITALDDSEPEIVQRPTESAPVQHPLLKDVLTIFDGQIENDTNSPWED